MNQINKMTWVVSLLMLVTAASAQDKLTEHTYQLNEGKNPAVGNLADVAWLVGSWQGTAFGSQFEEVWNPASMETMVGMFKLYDAEKGVNFYELMLLKEVDDSLELLVKHFGADFTAWEEKADFVTFKLVKVEPDAVHFSGLSFYRQGADQIDGFIVMKHQDGSRTEHPINYLRVK